MASHEHVSAVHTRYLADICFYSAPTRFINDWTRERSLRSWCWKSFLVLNFPFYHCHRHVKYHPVLHCNTLHRGLNPLRLNVITFLQNCDPLNVKCANVISFNCNTFDPLYWTNGITFTGFRITWPRQWLLILRNQSNAAISDFNQSEFLTHILRGPNVMEMSSALRGPNISPYYTSITFAPLYSKCNYIRHTLIRFTARTISYVVKYASFCS